MCKPSGPMLFRASWPLLVSSSVLVSPVCASRDAPLAHDRARLPSHLPLPYHPWESTAPLGRCLPVRWVWTQHLACDGSACLRFAPPSPAHSPPARVSPCGLLYRVLSSYFFGPLTITINQPPRPPHTHHQHAQVRGLLPAELRLEVQVVHRNLRQGSSDPGGQRMHVCKGHVQAPGAFAGAVARALFAMLLEPKPDMSTTPPRPSSALQLHGFVFSQVNMCKHGTGREPRVAHHNLRRRFKRPGGQRMQVCKGRSSATLGRSSTGPKHHFYISVVLHASLRAED